VAFSCVLGVCKPDPEIFLHACRSLGLRATECAYVGDGGGHELTAAAALGMRALRLRVPGEGAADSYDDDAFAGPEVISLRELLALPWVRAPESTA
jgi:putative hydrolase of the HAD superfamily